MGAVASRRALLFAAAALAAGAAAEAAAQTSGRRNPADPATWTSGLSKDYKPPEDVSFRVVSFQSEGVRLHGEIFAPRSAAPGQKLPTVVSAHGWGGVAASLRTDAVQLARAGFQVFNFDYRGWGESDGRVILTGAYPDKLPADRKFTAQVEAIRGYVDPWEQAEDWFNAINFIVGEPTTDPSRIGVRGSSYSGGLVLYVAAHDDRVKAVASQVGGMASRPDPANLPKPGTPGYRFYENRHAAGVRMARGETGYPEPGAIAIGSLIGAPVGNKMSRWWPNEAAYDVTAPTIVILAENEELVDNKTNGIRAYERVKGPKKLVIIPGIKHYGIYNEAREQAVDEAARWFKEHLK